MHNQVITVLCLFRLTFQCTHSLSLSPFVGPSGSVASTPVGDGSYLRPGSTILLQTTVCQETDGEQVILSPSHSLTHSLTHLLLINLSVHVKTVMECFHSTVCVV